MLGLVAKKTSENSPPPSQPKTTPRTYHEVGPKEKPRRPHGCFWRKGKRSDNPSTLKHLHTVECRNERKLGSFGFTEAQRKLHHFLGILWPRARALEI